VRRAGVSSFGISGTNAHVIIEEAPSATQSPEQSAEPSVLSEGTAWLVSGRTSSALTGQAERLAEHIAARPELDPVDVGWSLATTRSAFEHRAVVVGRDRVELLGGLVAVAGGQPSARP
jgi:acyl transferase domain-containing protein